MRYFATLGYTPEVLLDVKKFTERKPDVVVFHGDVNAQQLASNETARASLKRLGVAARFIEVPEPWDFMAGFRAMSQVYREDADEDLVVNASGGTEVLNSAATMFGVMTMARCRYLNRRTGLVTEVDMFPITMAMRDEGSRYDVLQHAIRRGGAVPMGELPGLLGVTAGAVSQMVKLLEGFGLATIEVETGTTDRRRKEVRVSRSLWPLVELKRDAGVQLGPPRE